MTQRERRRARPAGHPDGPAKSIATDTHDSTQPEGRCPRCGAVSREPVALADYLDHFRWRVLQDGLAEATATYWLKRADDFEQAKPVEPAGGWATPAAAERARLQWKRCEETAQACRNAAEMARRIRTEGVVA